jgi:hypothetical protein
MRKLCINFYGPPSAGKTVAATSLFAELKKKHLDVELVSEFAKDCVMEENKSALKNQLFIWSTQQYRIFCGYEHARVVVTDSPILLGAIYNKSPALTEVIFEEYHKYNNLNVVLQLDGSRPYSMIGRVHSFEESVGIGNQIMDLLESRDIPFLSYGDISEEELVSLIVTELDEED